MREEHSLVGFGSLSFYSKLYNPRWPHTPEEHTLEMRVDVVRLRRMENVLSQPAPPPQFDSSPRRSPAIGTGSDEPGVSRAGTESTEREYTFPLQASIGSFLHVCKSPEQGTTILLQAEIGANDETTTTKSQAATRLPIGRQHERRL